jgi:large subunit ribosomal protein L18
MESSQKTKKIARQRRVWRVRKGLKGNAEKPRLSIYRSNAHLFAQIIDDEAGKTLVGMGTVSKSLKKTKMNKKGKEPAAHLAELIVKAAKEKNIERVVFDRGRYKYHGLIKHFADAARKAGLQF